MLHVGHMPCRHVAYLCIPCASDGVRVRNAAMTRAYQRRAASMSRPRESSGRCWASGAEPALRIYPLAPPHFRPDGADRVRADHSICAGPAAAAGGRAGGSREGCSEEGSQGRGGPRQGSQTQEGAGEAAQGRHACCQAAHCCQVGAACAAGGSEPDLAVLVRGAGRGVLLVHKHVERACGSVMCKEAS